jgi:hypothetical protein
MNDHGSRPATLIVMAGLPATGKTTIARELARPLGAVHVRIDTIEHAIRQSGGALRPAPSTTRGISSATGLPKTTCASVGSSSPIPSMAGRTACA